MLFAALGVAVFAAYVNSTPAAQRVAPDLRKPEKDAVVRPHDRISRPKSSGGPSVEVQTEPSVFVATFDGDNVKLVPAHAAPSGENPMQYALNSTLKNLHMDAVKVIGVDVKERVALIDFNPALTEGMGSQEEANFMEALRLTLGQFKEIDKFQMRVDGEFVEEFGHETYEGPQDVKRSGKSEPASSEESPTPSEDPASAAPR